MKKITLLTLLIGTPLFAQVTVYTDEAAFDTAYESTLTMEDFSGAPDEPFICGNVVSSEANDCFEAGELVAGFAISTLDDGPVVLLPAGFLPSDNQSPRLGANAGADTTVITFTGEDAVYAAGHALHVDNNGSFNYKVYNDEDAVIYDEDHEHSPFFGIISTDAVTRIEISSVNDNGELIGDLQFGTQGTMGIIDNDAVNFTCYPNPAGNTLNIVSRSAIAEVSVINLLGQRVAMQHGVDNTMMLDVSSIASGTYFVTVASASGVISTQKIIKE